MTKGHGSVLAFSTCGVGSQSAEDADLEDALGEWDDAEEELYLARLSQWESRQHLLNVADIVPGQVSSSPDSQCPKSRQPLMRQQKGYWLGEHCNMCNILLYVCL